MLVGSNKQPATFIDATGKTVALGDVVARAFTASMLTEDGWNAAPDSERERFIAEAVTAMGLTAPSDPPPSSEPEPQPVEGLAVASAKPLPSVTQAINDLDENPGRTASLSEAGYVVRDGAV